MSHTADSACLGAFISTCLLDKRRLADWRADRIFSARKGSSTDHHHGLVDITATRTVRDRVLTYQPTNLVLL